MRGIKLQSDEYAKLDAVALAVAIKRGEVTCSEVIEAAISAIELLNPQLNAVVIENFQNARQAAASNIADGALAGAPFLLKDVNVFTHDMPTTFSCRFFRDARPRADSEIVRRWRNAGLIVTGKTNTPEFAEDFVCEPTFRGAALNPWNLAVTTGGSSGGAGAAVASGMVPLAHGTDLGGSIRIPAACCGVYGLKPTTGLNPVDASSSGTGQRIQFRSRTDPLGSGQCGRTGCHRNTDSGIPLSGIEGSAVFSGLPSATTWKTADRDLYGYSVRAIHAVESTGRGTGRRGVV